METPKLEDVANAIYHAFAGVSREGGISLHEALILDYSGTFDSTNRKHRAMKSKDRDQDWVEVPEADIAAGYQGLCFVDAIGFRYYLPAYIIWSLKNFGSRTSDTAQWTLYALGRGTTRSRWEDFEEKLSLFTVEQRTAVAQFLRYMLMNARDEIDEHNARQSYENYWKDWDSVG